VRERGGERGGVEGLNRKCEGSEAWRET
jgi:hypothetical protein